jgi:2-polyprenyl-6-methoxyphenol hydroxylase-like FAD-dependent oxidoreductase
MRLAAVNEEGGVALRLSSRVARVDAKEGYVELQDGTREYGDLIIGADGIKSAVRQSVLGSSSQGQAQPTGLSAFRFLVATEVFENNANARELMKWKNPGATLLGDPNSVEVHEERHLMWYPCRE